MEKDKQAGITKLKLRLDAVRKTGNAENIKQIEDMIAELGGETDASETATDASTKNTEGQDVAGKTDSKPPKKIPNAVLQLFIDESAKNVVNIAKPSDKIKNVDCDFVKGRKGMAISLNGMSSYLELPKSLSIKKNVTIMLWVKLKRGRLNWIISEGENNKAISLAINDSTFIYFLAGEQLTSKNPVEVDSWTHIAATWDGKTQIIYINGVESNRVEKTSPTLNTPTNPLNVGREAYDKGRNYFGGLIEDLVVLDKALPAEEIKKFIEK